MSLGYEEFADRLLAALGEAHRDAPPPTARLQEDLGFDSFQVIELLTYVEQGHEPPDDPPRLSSLGDAFEYHQRLAASTAVEREIHPELR